MFRSSSRCLAIAVIGLAVLSGCSSDDDQAPAVSAWLGPLQGMKLISGDENTGVYVDRRNGAAPAVDSVYIPAVQLTVAQGTSLEALSDRDFERVREMLQSSIRKAVAGQVKLADAPSQHSYTLRVALTNVLIDQRRTNVYRPGPNDFSFGFRSALLQSSLRDGPANIRRAATMISAGDGLSQQASEATWAELPRHFDQLAARLAGQIARAKAEIANARTAAPAKSPENKK